jgi:hypothetical protein
VLHHWLGILFLRLTTRAARRAHGTIGEMRMGTLMIKCPNTGRSISTGIQVEQAKFDAMPVFFAHTLCPVCRTEHRWFAKHAWVNEIEDNFSLSRGKCGAAKMSYRYPPVTECDQPRGASAISLKSAAARNVRRRQCRTQKRDRSK